MRIPLVFKDTIDEQKYVKHPNLVPWIPRDIEDLMNMYFRGNQQMSLNEVLRQINLPEEVFICVVLILTYYWLEHGILRHSFNDSYRNIGSENYDLKWFFLFENKVKYTNEEAIIVEQIQWANENDDVRTLFDQFHTVSWCTLYNKFIYQ